ncbi:unnamed protein product [Lactuca virosa]|uniref:Uncharacterized protein n=1 Tax=Lactuca virosa TaxID=75947 RepID=A0AAU9LX88_9ASTR|nr:unnamed protein product [Lactuca virosa]
MFSDVFENLLTEVWETLDWKKNCYRSRWPEMKKKKEVGMKKEVGTGCDEDDNGEESNEVNSAITTVFSFPVTALSRDNKITVFIVCLSLNSLKNLDIRVNVEANLKQIMEWKMDHLVGLLIGWKKLICLFFEY